MEPHFLRGQKAAGRILNLGRDGFDSRTARQK